MYALSCQLSIATLISHTVPRPRYSHSSKMVGSCTHLLYALAVVSADESVYSGQQGLKHLSIMRAMRLHRRPWLHLFHNHHYSYWTQLFVDNSSIDDFSS